MKSRRVVALAFGCLLVLPGIGLLLGGGGLGLAYATGRDSAGFYEFPLSGLHSETAAISAGEAPLVTAGPVAGGGWADTLDTDIRLRVTPTDSDTSTFIGVGPAAEVHAYLTGVAHDEITGITTGSQPTYDHTGGTTAVSSPTAQTFWSATSVGNGPTELSWKVAEGSWAVVVMHPDGTPGIDASAGVDIKTGFLLPLSVILFSVGLLMTAGAVLLIVRGASGGRSGPKNMGEAWSGGYSAVPRAGAEPTADATRPVVLNARIDPGLSRWQWLVKWFLAIPHFVVLAFLWPAFVVVTVVAGISILFTGRYPQSLFDFNRGVLRWSWRVSFYAVTGGIGTDQYPPFSLRPRAGYPATLDIAYPATFSRGLVLIKWLLAVPHLLIIGVLLNDWWSRTSLPGDQFTAGPIGTGGVLGLLVVIAGVVLLFTGKYPPALFALIIGCNRWIFRVIAYVALMTDTYPPFRLDQGGTEPIAPTPTLPKEVVLT
jgi:hypothetical protein